MRWLTQCWPLWGYPRCQVMFREDPASRLMLLSPLGIPQGAGVLEIDITQHPGHSGTGTLFTDNLNILPTWCYPESLGWGFLPEERWGRHVVRRDWGDWRGPPAPPGASWFPSVRRRERRGERCLLVWRHRTTETGDSRRILRLELAVTTILPVSIYLDRRYFSSSKTHTIHIYLGGG